ncbi:hypothetical protein HMPREF3198_02081 [Winkia neuii]|nr:hypothetical protein HMPREF3198_02081 [Winkia neuii]
MACWLVGAGWSPSGWVFALEMGGKAVSTLVRCKTPRFAKVPLVLRPIPALPRCQPQHSEDEHQNPQLF